MVGMVSIAFLVNLITCMVNVTFMGYYIYGFTEIPDSG